jgi:hypothetical protein
MKEIDIANPNKEAEMSPDEFRSAFEAVKSGDIKSRVFGANQIKENFKKLTTISLPDSMYVMDALDTFDKFAKSWKTKQPTNAEIKEWQEMAKITAEEVYDEMKRDIGF